MEGPVTQETVIKKLGKLTPEGLAEVSRFIDRLQKASKRRHRPQREDEHPGFGIWADRIGLSDSVAFANMLRESIENRQDGGYHHE